MMMFLLLVMVMIEMISSHLLLTTTLTRHGTRAPNPVVIDVCPGPLQNDDRDRRRVRKYILSATFSERKTESN